MLTSAHHIGITSPTPTPTGITFEKNVFNIHLCSQIYFPIDYRIAPPPSGPFPTYSFKNLSSEPVGTRAVDLRLKGLIVVVSTCQKPKNV